MTTDLEEIKAKWLDSDARIAYWSLGLTVPDAIDTIDTLIGMVEEWQDQAAVWKRERDEVRADVANA